jgi:radical SAM protein with 4Fe4S-binding SPASM domain
MNKLVIDPTGRIKPCYSINEELGRVGKTSIKKAWTLGLSSDIRKLKVFPKICKSCKYVYECLGGCRFAAKLVNGDYDSLDPLAQPEKYKNGLFNTHN